MRTQTNQNDAFSWFGNIRVRFLHRIGGVGASATVLNKYCYLKFYQMADWNAQSVNKVYELLGYNVNGVLRESK